MTLAQAGSEFQGLPDAAETVRSIAAAGVSVCVASQGKLEKTDLSLAITGLDGLFARDARFSVHTVPRGKPWPDLFLHAAARMGAPARVCCDRGHPLRRVRGGLGRDESDRLRSGQRPRLAARGGRATALLARRPTGDARTDRGSRQP